MDFAFVTCRSETLDDFSSTSLIPPPTTHALFRRKDIARSKKDIGEMMSIWAPNATFTYGPGKTATGKKQIEEFWTKSIAFQHDTDWVSDHPAWKMRVTVNGDRGTLHFECHFIEVGTQKVAAVTAADQDVALVNNRWVVTNMVGGTAELKS